ncbi:MAG TPA: hypothetical protein VFU22_07155 [Roseiflexaceae bacterium]|nr:hypothetical protein [Roseiflexaceae bacterium]
MQFKKQWMLVALIVAGLQLASCGQTPSVAANKIHPATVEKIDGSDFNRVKLTEKAAQRLAIQTSQINEEQINGAQRKVIPYSAVVYGLKGETWAYTNPEPLTFIRQPITVDYIEGDKVVLVDGPASGTVVVTVGVAELYGTDTGIGK